MMNYVVAPIIFVAASTLTALIWGFLLGPLNTLSAGCSLIVGLGVAYLAEHGRKRSARGEGQTAGDASRQPLGFWTITVFFIFALFALKSFIWFFYVRNNDTLAVGSPHNLGDAVLHLCHIRYFANGVHFWPDSPIVSTHKLCYPVGIDLFNSLLYSVGVGAHEGIVWVGLISSAITLYALYRWGKTFTVAGFLFNGGLAGFLFFQNFKIPFETLTAGVFWKNLALTLFVPQRGFLFALPVGLLLLDSWRSRFFTEDSTNQTVSRNETMPFWVEMFLLVSLPFFHVHTFLVLCGMLLFWLLFFARLRGPILKIAAVVFLPAVCFIVLLTDSFKTLTGIHFAVLWGQNNMGFIPYWLTNFGLLPALVLWLLVQETVSIEGSRVRFRLILNSVTAFVFPAILFFILFSFVMLSSWDWDNVKLLVWSYLIVLPFLWDRLIRTWHYVLKMLAIFILFFSGFLVMVYELGDFKGYDLFRIAELREVEAVVSQLPIEDRFACYPTYNHALIYSGRKVLMGYPPWAVAHGLSREGDEKKIEYLMRGGPGWQMIAQQLHARYIFWGEKEKYFYPKSLRPWEAMYQKIAEGTWGEIYDLKQPKTTAKA